MDFLFKKTYGFKTKLCFLISCFLLTGFWSCSNLIEETLNNEDKPVVNTASTELAVAKVTEPLFREAGVSKNKAIVLSFSKSMDPQTFLENFSISDSLGNNLKSYFLEPQWSNENKLVKIPADENNLIDLRGKKYMDIYVTLSKNCRSIDNEGLANIVDYRYRICDTIDNLAPEMVYVMAEVPGEYLNSPVITEPVTLIEGELNLDNEEEICTTNHINSKLDFYVEGFDYDGGEVSANIILKRIYDSLGNEVFDDEQQFISLLENVNSSGNSFSQFCLDLSGEAFLDGMYKLSVTVVDSSNFVSNIEKTYYIIRDTTLAYNTNALMWFETPLFSDYLPEAKNEDDEEPVALSDFDAQIPYVSNIEFFRNRVQFNYISDDVFYVSQQGTGKSYKQPVDDFTYMFAWGTNLDELTEPVLLEGQIETNPSYTANPEGQKVFELPQDFINYCRYFENKEIFLQATVLDSVGNSNIITMLIPGVVELYNYEILPEAGTDSEANDESDLQAQTESEEIDFAEGFAEETESQTEEETASNLVKVKINYSDMSTEFSNVSKIPDKHNQVIYRVFYGRLEDEMEEQDINLLPLKRNIALSLTDSSVLEMEKGAKYIVFVQPCYIATSTTNGQWCGQTYGPLSKLIVDTDVSTVSVFEAPEFTVEKENAGINTGLFKINVAITNPQEDVRYVPCFTTDGGNNWIYYNSEASDSFTFVVNNPLKAPLGKNAAWDKTEWQDKTYFEAVQAVRAYSYDSVVAGVKILAIKDNQSKESEIQKLEFTEEDDNIPPSQSGLIGPHDSMLSFDGHSFKYDSMIIENEGHAEQGFEYFYMPYNETWADNLSIAAAQQIESLPGGTGLFESYTWRDNDGAKYSISPIIPVNGLKDGKYMFFARVYDSYGNYNYITLGKANISTFKNQLNVQYDTKTRSFISRLRIEQGEKFDRNMINVQVLKNNNGTRNWEHLYGVQNELQNCELVESAGKKTLFNQTDKNYYYYENELASKKGIKTKRTQEIIPGTFYRITMQGFNEKSYDEATGQGVNIRYGRPYNENLKKESIVPYVDGETEYDLCTGETVSNTVYYYVPANETELKNFKCSFFTSTASPRSNKPFIVNVISSMYDLGNNIDEWERRGKLVKTHFYMNSDDSDTRFNDNTAMNDMAQAHEKGLVYYAAIVHFADNSSAISNVYTMQGY